MRYLRTMLWGALLGTCIACTMKLATGCRTPEPQTPPGYKENPY